MAITLQSQPISASAALAAADVSAIFAAILPLVVLPTAENGFANCTALNITVQPNGSGVINVRFSK